MDPQKQLEMMKDGLKGVLPEHQRDELIRLAKRKSLSKWRSFGIPALIGVGLGAAAILLERAFDNAGMPEQLRYVILVFVCIASAILSSFFYRHDVGKQRAWLVKELIRKNLRPNLCLKCGYNLRGTTAEACPECGCALAPVEEAAPED